VVKLHGCGPSYSTLQVTACDHYVAPDWHWYTTSGTYTATIPNHCGQDSTIIMVVTIPTVDLSVTNLSGTLTANATNATFQWLDCNNGYAILPGETNAALSLPVTGSFAVIVSQNGCSDTSECYIDGIVHNAQPDLQPDFAVFPSPSQGKIAVTASTPALMHIADAAGKWVFAAEVPMGRSDYDLGSVANGVYHIQFQYPDGITSTKLVILRN
jgi:hypothetical protein